MAAAQWLVPFHWRFEASSRGHEVGEHPGMRRPRIRHWHELEKTQREFRGEWYVSSDILRKDADGYLIYCGRGDDMLKVGGKWLAPAEVEKCTQIRSSDGGRRKRVKGKIAVYFS